MIISVINHTDGKIADEEIHRVVRAVNRQIEEDFRPYWSLGATVRLEGRGMKAPSRTTMLDMRGDAILYLWDEVDVDGALGYHDANARGIPYGFVFTELSSELGEPWSVTFSHEALELIADPQVNLLVMGPHPADPDRTVFHWYEMADAVQTETYEIDHVAVSNFVLPLYFTGSDEPGGRNDYLGRVMAGKPLNSFGVNPGGYIGFYDPETGQHESFTRDGDTVAAKRLALKGEARTARRAARYTRFTEHSAALAGARRRARGGTRGIAPPEAAPASNVALETPGTRRETGV